MISLFNELHHDCILFSVVNQFYDAEIIKEYVMRGNSAIVKCSIPSFVADFVHVVAWVDDEGEEYVRATDYSQGREKLSETTQ